MQRLCKAFNRTITTMANNLPPKDPMIVIVGATGTGKSKLAVSLATKYNGEIINADAIQMYRGLPIVTNKIPEHERNGIPHHLLDRIEIGETPWTVNEFIEETSKLVQEIRGRGKLPVVVGGTNYYVFSLLFKGATLGLDESGSESGSDDEGRRIDFGMGTTVELSGSAAEAAHDINGTTTTGPVPDLSILDEPTEVVLAKLRELDPVMADSWHPKDRRKIQRSLEICLKKGRKASEIYEEQKFIRRQRISEAGAPTLRYEPLIFWLEAEDASLKKRLNSRVDTMIAEGLLDEVMEMRAFAEESRRNGITLDQMKGIWIAIGYKQMSPWLDSCHQGSTDAKVMTALKHAGIEDVKASTRQYARRQHRFIRIRIAQHLRSAGILHKLFLLDGTDLDAWDRMVADPSQSITDKYLSGLPLPANRSLSDLSAQTFDYMESTLR